MTEADKTTEEFFGIANELISDEANDFLAKRLKKVDQWVAYRKLRNQPADLRSLIDQLMREPEQRAMVLVAYAAALWKIREMEGKNEDQ